MEEFPVKQPPARAPIAMIVFIIVLSIGVLAFGIAAIIFFNQASTATNTLNEQKSAAAKVAREDQKKIDAADNLASLESPFRSYTAPTEYGGFHINFPKNWSASVDHERSANTQVNLVLHPDFIQRNNGIDDLVATHVQLIQKTNAEFLKQYSTQKTLKLAPTTVSGLAATQITGTFPDKRTIKMVVVPVRDKVIIFSNESKAQSNEFEQVLSQSKILP